MVSHSLKMLVLAAVTFTYNAIHSHFPTQSFTVCVYAGCYCIAPPSFLWNHKSHSFRLPFILELHFVFALLAKQVI